MTHANFNYFYRVDITAVTYTGNASASSATWSFTNKFLKDSTSATAYIPILKSIGEISVAAGEFLPNISLSAVEIDNRIGVFGANRRFSDILQRYTVVERSIVFYMAQVANDTDAVSSWTQIGQGVVTNWEASTADGDDTLRFDVKAAKYSETVLTLEVARTVSGMENAPTSSLGRAVPLLVGSSLEVNPVRISADGGTTAKYALGTGFYQHLNNVTSGCKIYGKTSEDEWQEMTGIAYSSNGTATVHGTVTLNTYAAYATYLAINGPSIVTGIELRAQANGLASSTAELRVFLMRTKVRIPADFEEIASATIPLSNYDSLNSNVANTFFPVKVSFDRPVVMATGPSYGSFYNYYIGFSVTGYQVGDLSLHAGSAGVGVYVKDAADAVSGSANSYDKWKYIGGPKLLLFALHELTYAFTDHVSAFTQSGLTYTSLTVSQVTPDSGQVNPSLDNLPFLVANVQGLSAYSGGAVKSRPQELAELLGYSWNGSAWADSAAWDGSTLSSSHYDKLYNGGSPNFRSRVAKAVFESKTTYSQFLAEVCRGTASRVGVLSTGKSFMYPFGATVTPAFDVPAADIAGLTWEQRGVDTVINRAIVKTGRSYLYAPRSFESSNEAVGYQYTTDYSGNNQPQVAAITMESRTLYGNRDLAQNEFLVMPDATGGIAGYLGDSSAQGSILAEYYLGRFGKPLVYCSFVVPYHRYSDIRMFDVITLTSVQFPAFYGVDPNARDGVVDTGGGNVTTVTTADGGYETVRAQTYRGLVEGVSLVLAMENAPALRLTVQVLLNQPYDPT